MIDMEPSNLQQTLAFLREAERLKNQTRTAWTSEGRRESVAEHTWRLCLLALLLEDEFPDVDLGKLLRICIVHDLGEAIGGDISAVAQTEPKAAQERDDLLTLLEPLPPAKRARIVALWDEYESAATPEARVAKALDKIETIVQHNQGSNPDDFDYAFNLEYGRQYTGDQPVIAALRALVDEDTARHARERRRR